MGLGLGDAMLGEVTAAMACAVGSSSAHKILIPVSRCQVTVAGTVKQTLTEAVEAAVTEAVTRLRGR